MNVPEKDTCLVVQAYPEISVHGLFTLNIC
jgi:hypothetical protein